jgi:hypothetical protein
MVRFYSIISKFRPILMFIILETLAIITGKTFVSTDAPVNLKLY